MRVPRRAERLQNHTLLDNAATSIGCGVPHLHPTQLLRAAENRQVVLQQAKIVSSK